MKKHLIPILIALCVLTSACGKKAVSGSSGESISVYRVLKLDYQSDGELIKPENLTVENGANPVLQAASAIAGVPNSDKLKSPLPSGVEILEVTQKDNCVTVYMNSEYLNINGIDKSILDCCMTLTMCSVKGVDCLTICVGNITVESKLSTEDFLLFDNIVSSAKAQVRLYFPKYQEQSLGSEYRTIVYGDDSSVERSILDALFEGPMSDELERVFPLGTIVLSVYTQDGVCSVSLSGISAGDATHSYAEAELAVYSVVNSLTSFSDIRSVQILIDGKQVPSLWGFDISDPITKNDSIIGSAAKG